MNTLESIMTLELNQPYKLSLPWIGWNT